MQLIVKKSTTLTGSITPPSSKSQSIRGMIFALLANGESILTNVLQSEDTDDAIRTCRDLGAMINHRHDQLIFTSSGIPLITATPKIHTGNSGITTRFIMPALGLRSDTRQPIIVDCGAQMRARPIHSLVNALRNLGMTLNYIENENILPVSISGNLAGGKTEIDGITSQYLSALLISLPLAPNDSEITVHNLHERPYVEMTLKWLAERNINYSHEQHKGIDIYRIQGNQTYQPFHSTIPGDFSSASYLIAAAALIPGEVTLNGLDMTDPQGDKRLVTLLQEMGADIFINADHIIIRGGKPLRGIHIDANDIPDLLPTLAVIGTQANSPMVIDNVPQARIKETDRIHSMAEGLTRLGAHIIEKSDGMTIHPSQLQGAQVLGYGDHRTVMALSLAGMLATGTTSISDAEAINKTFPSYISLMRSLGANMELDHE